MNVWLAMEGVLRYAPILLEASRVPATLATLLVLMQDHVWVSNLLDNVLMILSKTILTHHKQAILNHNS